MIGWIILCCVITAIVVFFLTVEFTTRVIASSLSKKTKDEIEEWFEKIRKCR